MAKRVILAGVLGGLAIFVWGSLSHMVLGLGAAGIKGMPNEDAVLSAMHTSIPEPGFYIFPSMGLAPNTATREQWQAAMPEIQKRAKSGPNGILVFRPNNGVEFSARTLGVEFGLNLVQALLLAILLAWAGANVGAYTSRVLFVAVAGLLGALSTNVQYWNWYGFPSSYTAAYIANELAGFVIAGLVMAAILKPRMAEVRGMAAAA